MVFNVVGPLNFFFVSVASVATYPVESWTTSILEDDRLALHYQRYSDLIFEEAKLIEELPTDIWQRLAEVVDIQRWSRVREACARQYCVSD